MRAIVIAIVAGIVGLVVAVAWLAYGAMRPDDPAGLAGEEGLLGTPDEGVAGSVDSLARIQVAELEALVLRLEEEVAALNDEVLALRVELQRLEQSPAAAPGTYEGELPESIGPGIEDYAAVVLIPERRGLNQGLSVATPSFLEEFLGRPRERLSDRCEPMTNARLKAMLRLDEVGPIQVRMLEPAIESLRGIFERVRGMDQDLYDRIDTAGSLCVRQIRGTQGRTSTHSFGLAVDINIDGVLDTFGDGRTQLGLLLMSDLFLEEGWVWGAGYGREDSMHFEVSREKLEDWREQGRI